MNCLKRFFERSILFVSTFEKIQNILKKCYNTKVGSHRGFPKVPKVFKVIFDLLQQKTIKNPLIVTNHFLI